MGSYGVDERVWDREGQMPRSGGTPCGKQGVPCGKQGVWWLAGVLAMVLAGNLLLCFAGPAVASQVAVLHQANKGLASGVAVPSWAAHRHIHFLPGLEGKGVAGLRGAPLEQGVLAGADKGLEQRLNLDRPALYHEGKGVQHRPHVYVTFWGSSWNEPTGSALRTQLLHMYQGLSGSSYQDILTQYFDSTGRISSTVTVTSYTDEGVTAPTSVNNQMIGEEAAKAIAAKGWPRELDSQFVVIPAPGSTYEARFDKNFCGYHEIVEESDPSHDYTYTFIPFVGEEPFYSGCIGYDESKNADNVTSMVHGRLARVFRERH